MLAFVIAATLSAWHPVLTSISSSSSRCTTSAMCGIADRHAARLAAEMFEVQQELAVANEQMRTWYGTSHGVASSSTTWKTAHVLSVAKERIAGLQDSVHNEMREAAAARDQARERAFAAEQAAAAAALATQSAERLAEAEALRAQEAKARTAAAEDMALKAAEAASKAAAAAEAEARAAAKTEAQARAAIEAVRAEAVHAEAAKAQAIARARDSEKEASAMAEALAKAKAELASVQVAPPPISPHLPACTASGHFAVS